MSRSRSRGSRRDRCVGDNINIGGESRCSREARCAHNIIVVVYNS